MKRVAALLVIASVAAFAVTGCRASTPTTTTPAKGSATASTTADPPFVMVNKDKVYLNPTETFDPAKFPKTAMTGAPSNIPFFKPAKDEGIINRVYPTYDSKTFKFFISMSECLEPQWYYMFKKNGGTLNPAVAQTGFKFADIFDGGHLKTQSNLMVGYYDFAFVTPNILTELWSGNETQAQEMWRGGSDYVIIGNSFNGGVDLLAAPDITNLKQLAGKTVGIMNVGYHSEAMLNKALATVGLATESAGGNVKIVMGTPGFIMNNMMAKKIAAGFVWKKYADELAERSGFKTLLKWSDMGYGTQMPNLWLIVRKDIIAKYPEIVQAVVQANYDATKQAATSSDYKAPNDAVYNEYKIKYYGAKPNIVNPPQSRLDARANPAFLREVIDYMTKCGYFKVPYTYDQLVDQSFYDKVKK